MRYSWTLRLYALPYIILWSLSVYGLIRFNDGKFGSELFYGSVISFWLIHHIINLTFAIFCAVGRPSYRAFVRFPVDETINIKVDGWAYKRKVQELSETFLVTLNFFSLIPKASKRKGMVK